MDFREKVLNILTEVCQDDIVKENPDIEVFNEGLLDSFGIVNLLLSIEEELGINLSISEFDREEWSTPNLIVQKLEDKK